MTGYKTITGMSLRQLSEALAAGDDALADAGFPEERRRVVEAYARGRAIAEKLKDVIPRQLFEIPIQAAIGGKAS